MLYFLPESKNTAYICVSQDWVFIYHNLAQNISSVTEKEVVTSSTSLKQSSNRCSREGRNPASLTGARSGEKSNRDWGANDLQVDREEKPWHTTTTVTTADSLPLRKPHLVSCSLTFTSSNPWSLPPLRVTLCPYLVFGTVRTTQSN